MSRIGKLPVTVPSGVNVTLDSDAVLVKGPKGELRQAILSGVVGVKLEDGTVIVERKGDAKRMRKSIVPRTVSRAPSSPIWSKA